MLDDYSFFPLTRGETHKNDVLHFATAKASDCRKSTTMTDRESAALLWDLLVLLCRQNGVRDYENGRMCQMITHSTQQLMRFLQLNLTYMTLMKSLCAKLGPVS